jgi:transposase
MNRDGESVLHKNRQAATEPFLKAIAPNRDGVAVRFPDPAVHKSIAVALALLGYDDQRVTALEWPIVRTAKHHDANTCYRLRSIPGVGQILALVMLYAIHAIQRLPSAQDFVSSCRLVTCAKESASTAPAGSAPVFRKRHRAISNCRASAAIPSVRRRALPCPNRACYPCVNVLAG